MHRNHVTFGLVALLALASSPARADEKEAFGRLTVDEVQRLVESKGAQVYDNNNQERFARGHVPGAKWVRASELSQSDLGANKGEKLVFYCANQQCGACHTAAKKAIALGFRNVYIMPDGIAGWEKAGKPVEKG